MKIRAFSDIHIEFDRGYKKPLWRPVPMSDDLDTVLVLAGDIEVAKHTKEYVESLADQFLAIVYVLGNHDFYGGNLDKEYIRAASDLPNVHMLQNEFVVINGVKILGTTLWTDMNREDPLTVWNAKQTMNDFRQIKMGKEYSRLTSARWLFENKIAGRFLEKEVEEGCVVVTHHAPSFACKEYGKPDYSSGYYYNNDLDDVITTAGLWIFGHTHEAFDEEVLGTRIVANPRGYANIDGGAHLVREFNEELVIDV